MTIKWRHCAIAERDHREDIRNYAHTFHYPRTICFAKAFWELPREYQDGILLHEIGHLLAGPKGSESEANDAVFDWIGSRIDYVDSPYGRRLERVNDMAGAAIIRRRSVILNPIGNATIASYRSVLRTSAPSWAHEWKEGYWGDIVRATLTRLERKYNERLSDETFDELYHYGMAELEKAASCRVTRNPDDPHDIDWKQRYGEAEQPEVARYLGHERPADRPEPDSPRAFWKERSDGKYRVEFVYPRTGARVTKIMTKQKFDEMTAEGKYLVYHSSR